MVLQGWDALLQPVVAKYGPVAVWRAALQSPLIGFPANWITTMDEVKKLRQILESGL